MQNKSAYIWNFGGRIVPQVIFLLTNIILAHYLSPSDFGQIGVLAIFISISSTLTEAGFGGSIIKEEKVLPIDLSTVFIYNLVVSLLLYSILFISSTWLESYFKIEGLANVSRVLGLVFVISAWSLIPKTILIKNLCFKQIAIVGVIGVIIASGISIICAREGFGVYALVAYQLTYVICEVICFEIITKYNLSFKFSVNSFKKLFSFGFFTTLCNIIDATYSNLMTALFGKYINIKSAGYLFQSQKLETAATNSLAQTINTVSFPILTKLKAKQDTFYNEANSLFRNLTLCIFPLFWIIVIYSEPIIVLIYGEEWKDASIYLSLLMVAGIFSVMESLTRNYIKSLGNVKKLAEYTLFKRIVGIICIILFLIIDPFYMLYGFIISTIIGYLANVNLYSQLIEIGYCKLLWNDLKSFIITLFFPLLLFTIHKIDNLLIETVLISIVLLFYYLLLLPKYLKIDIYRFRIKQNH